MELPEPVWRTELLAALQLAKTTRDFRQLEMLVQNHTADSFDTLVQAIVRGRCNGAVAVLRKQYPGSVERQFQIDHLMRAASDG